MSHDNRLKENMQEATDSDSSTDVSVQSVTGVGTGEKSITGQVKGTTLCNTSSSKDLRSSSKIARTLNLDQNQLQNSYSDFIRDLAEPQEVVDMERKERKKKKLRPIRRIGPKYTCIKRKKVKKNRHALANRGLADVAPDSYRNKYLKDNSSSPAIKSSSDKHADITPNHASMDTETSDAHTSLPSPLNLARFETRHTQGKIPQNPLKAVARLKSPPFRTRDHRTYATVLQTMDTPHHLMSAQETCLPQKPPKLDSMKETVIYSSKPEDISWLNNCLLASISAGANYGKIQNDLISCDIQSTRMRFLGASQVLLLFEDHPSMMHAFEVDLPFWDKYFDDIRPWPRAEPGIFTVLGY